MTWILFWKIVFITVLAAFAVMTAFTIVLGGKDVKELLRGLKEDEEESE